MDEKSKLKNDWKMTDEEMGNTNVPVIINKTYNELLQQLTDTIKKNGLDVDMIKISEAFTLAYESHMGQKRKSGEDYILHPVEVAEILAEWIRTRLWLGYFMMWLKIRLYLWRI